jgi:hypothetical protein
MMDDIMDEGHFECVIHGHSDRDVRRNTDRCCERNGGELNDQRGHCSLI